MQIKSFVVYLDDGRVIQVSRDDGEGYFREEHFKGSERSFSTYQCFVANGRVHLLHQFGGEMTNVPDTEPTDPPDDDEEDEE